MSRTPEPNPMRPDDSGRPAAEPLAPTSAAGSLRKRAWRSSEPSPRPLLGSPLPSPPDLDAVRIAPAGTLPGEPGWRTIGYLVPGPLKIEHEPTGDPNIIRFRATETVETPEQDLHRDCRPGFCSPLLGYAHCPASNP